MDIRQYEYILAIAEEASISKAAGRLHVSQPTLSQFLARLEREIGLPLFIHSRNGFFPTAEGQVYLEGARRIVETEADIRDRIEGMNERRGKRLRIGLTHGRSARLFSNFLPHFRRDSPEVEIEMVEAPIQNIDELARSGYLDLALVIGNAEDASLEFQPFIGEEIVFVMSRRHPLAREIGLEKAGSGSIDLRLFKDEGFILFKKGYRLRTLVDSHLAKVGFAPRISLETTESDLACNMVRNDLGLSFVPVAFADKYPDLLPIRLEPPMTWEFGVEYRKGASVSPAMRRFIELVGVYAREEGNWTPTLSA